jgi:hypothetical protein
MDNFYELFKNFEWDDEITIACEKCGKKLKQTKKSAWVSMNRKKNENKGKFLCRSCCYTEDGKTKIAKATSYKRSDKTKKQMSETAIKNWNSKEGEERKRIYSKRTAEQNASTDMNKSKRRVLYQSAKNNGQIRVCLSSGEFIACEDILEVDPNVASYEMQTSYEINNRNRNLDILIYYHDGKKKLIEIKPFKRIIEFAEQINDARDYAISQGWEFEIWTEKELGIKNWRDARDRADEYIKTHYRVDYAAYRAEMDRIKVRRYYNKKVSQDKVIIFCDFCKCYHSRLRITYERNIKKNGRFICITENGHNVGKRPAKVKDNPHGPDNKQCNKCLEVKAIEEFSKGKAACKKCRAKQYKEKYHEKK